MFKKTYTIALLILLIFNSAVIFAQQSNFSISPPPIPWYEFSKSDWDTRVGLTYVRITGEIEEDEISGDLNVNGGGANIFTRYAFSDILAADTGMLYAYAGGEIGDAADMTFSVFVLPFDIEFQPVKQDSFNILIFAGWNLAWTSININADGPPSEELNLETAMKGPQLGIEASFILSSFAISPYFMMSKLEGKSDVEIKENNSLVFSGSLNVSSTFVYNWGIDVLFIPYKITLSSILQIAGDSKDSQPYNTLIISVSYNFSNK
ncbi:MAG: hypothetical protein JW982_01620 [Spirochaetes bacterium]|nr:hypothetical protein [Spirochaetota bacterium]